MYGFMKNEKWEKQDEHLFILYPIDSNIMLYKSWNSFQWELTLQEIHSSKILQVCVYFIHILNLDQSIWTVYTLKHLNKQ